MRDKTNAYLAGFTIYLLGILVGVAICHSSKPAPQYVPVPAEQRCDDIIHYEDGSLICEIDLQRGQFI